MPVRYDKLVPALKTLLPDDTLSLLGRAVAFIRRLREIEASVFVRSVVLSRFGSGRPAFEQARQWYERLGGTAIWRRPFQMRFKSPRAVRLFEQAFETAVAPWRNPAWRRARHPLQRCFPDVVVWDSTLMQVADSLKKVFKGTRGAKASLKACVAISVFGLLPVFAEIVAGHRHDMVLFPPLHLFQRGTLLLFDKGFACYARLRTIANAGHTYLCPMRLNGNAVIVKVHSAPAFVRRVLRRRPDDLFLRDVLPSKKRLGRVWDLDVLVRPQANSEDPTWIRTRLVIVPGPEGRQHPYLTNLAPALWGPRALRELYRLRWQIRARLQGAQTAPQPRNPPVLRPPCRSGLGLGLAARSRALAVRGRLDPAAHLDDWSRFANPPESRDTVPALHHPTPGTRSGRPGSPGEPLSTTSRRGTPPRGQKPRD